MAGRPTKLTPERQEKIVQAILAGNYLITAFAYAGVGEQVGYEWLARGEGKSKTRPSNELYAKFAESVRQAEAQAETGTVAIIKQALPENPRLALDFLARRHPERWGQRDTLTVLKKLADEVESMTDEDLLLAARGRRARADQDAAGNGGAAEAGADNGDK